MAELISIAEAARELERDPSRVRALVVSGQLPGVRIGRSWAVDRLEVERRKRARPPAGRPFEPHNAWAILFLASDLEVDWIDAASLWRLRNGLVSHGVQGLRPRLRRRAQVNWFRVHPGELSYAANDSALRRSGISAAGAHGLDLVSGPELDGYLRKSEFERFKRSHALVPADRGEANVALRVVPDSAWHLDQAGSPAPIAAVALDLAEDPEPRSRRIGRDALRESDRALRRRPR